MDQSVRRVFVTGSGLLTGRAATVTDLWSMVMREEHAGLTGTTDLEIASAIGLHAGDLSILGRHQILSLFAVEQAWHGAGLSACRNRLRGEGGKVRHPRFACIGGSSLGGLVSMERDLAHSGGDRFSPYAVSRWRGNAVSAAVALRHGLGGTVLSLNAASATGSQILWMAGSLIRCGMADAVVAVAADGALSNAVFRAISRNGSVAKDAGSLPLSGKRSGMTPTEGAAAIILESEEHATSRQAVPIAEWLDGFSASECHHLQAPDPRGKVLEDLIRKVSSCSPEPVDWVSLHATGTRRFDSVECSTLSRVFGNRMPWISAFKRTTGHALSASGLIEGILVVEGLRSGSLPPPLSGIDETLGLAMSSGESPPVPATAIQIGQGMGGDVVVNMLAAIR